MGKEKSLLAEYEKKHIKEDFNTDKEHRKRINTSYSFYLKGSPFCYNSPPFKEIVSSRPVDRYTDHCEKILMNLFQNFMDVKLGRYVTGIEDNIDDNLVRKKDMTFSEYRDQIVRHPRNKEALMMYYHMRFFRNDSGRSSLSINDWDETAKQGYNKFYQTLLRFKL